MVDCEWEWLGERPVVVLTKNLVHIAIGASIGEVHRGNGIGHVIVHAVIGICGGNSARLIPTMFVPHKKTPEHRRARVRNHSEDLPPASPPSDILKEIVAIVIHRKYSIISKARGTLAIPRDDPPDNIVVRADPHVDDAMIAVSRVDPLDDEPAVVSERDRLVPPASTIFAVKEYLAIMERLDRDRLAR